MNSFILVRQLPASRIYIFTFAAADVDHDVFAFEEADELVPVRVGTVAVGGVVDFVIFDDIYFHRELTTEYSQCFGIFKTVIYAFQ